MVNLIHWMVLTAPAWNPIIIVLGIIIASWIAGKYTYKIFKESKWISKREVTKLVNDKRLEIMLELSRRITKLVNSINRFSSVLSYSDKDKQEQENSEACSDVYQSYIELRDFISNNLFLLGAASEESYKLFDDILFEMLDLAHSLNIDIQDYKEIGFFKFGLYEKRDNNYRQRQHKTIKDVLKNKDKLLKLSKELSKILRIEISKGVEVNIDD